MPSPYTDEQIAKALHNSKGSMFRAAEILKCSRQTIHNACNRNPELAAIPVDYRMSGLDIAEDKIREAAERGEPWAVCKIIDKLGGKVGYADKSETSQDVKIGGSVDVNVSELRETLAERIARISSSRSKPGSNTKP